MDDVLELQLREHNPDKMAPHSRTDNTMPSAGERRLLKLRRYKDRSQK
jgi:hypothetical protein